MSKEKRKKRRGKIGEEEEEEDNYEGDDYLSWNIAKTSKNGKQEESANGTILEILSLPLSTEKMKQ